ncbi:hypothetical protein [Streptomyces sp. NPDC058861]|uniref:hypothetical protein n=1 Tax=Streptomyces sp. NPDC058861 TaxID=3346653 RepID=UPI003686538C
MATGTGRARDARTGPAALPSTRRAPAGRPAGRTFVTRTPADASLAAHGPLQKDLRRWLTEARLAGLDDESIEALFVSTFRDAAGEDVA